MNPLRIDCLHIGDIELPREVSRLYDLAYNLWWTWNPEARQLFASIDHATWARYRNPVEALINLEPQRWEALLENEVFLENYSSVIEAFDRYMGSGGEAWFRRSFAEHDDDLIAYFSMEYGVHHSLAIYSGGLGVLSGDHCKSASDLGLPFVAVGLLYRHGYFRQTIDATGLQQHAYPEYDFSRLPLRPAAGKTGREILVTVPLPGRDVFAKVWVAQVGRVPLVLLDTDIPENHPADRPITDVLYVRGREMRLVQEMVLGVGGVRALRALDLAPDIWHLNEGHSAFLQLERFREVMEEKSVGFPQAREAVARRSVFTTHTPVTAGNEQFDAGLALRYLEVWAPRLGVPAQELLALGSATEDPTGQNLNLTAFAIRNSRATNGVSQLNGEIVDGMWRHLFPQVPAKEKAIPGITNGVHSPTWMGPELRRLLDRHLGQDWEDLLHDDAAWERVEGISPGEIWRAHQTQKERLTRFTRSRLLEQFARHGQAPDALRQVSELFDPDVLTVGFARRFATYKRANLIFSDLERLRELISNSERPVQIVFAGKAHPADRPGQELIQSIFQLSQSERLAGKVFFLENYDMRMGAMLVQGVDVWLNTPRRPMEASGTSGQKAAMNGALNFSVLDGWWPEAFDGHNGWVIGDTGSSDLGSSDSGSSDRHPARDPEAQDRRDAADLYDVLATRIVPLYYHRNESGLPEAWIARMKKAIASVTPHFSSSRMVRDYCRQAYVPALKQNPRGVEAVRQWEKA